MALAPPFNTPVDIDEIDHQIDHQIDEETEAEIDADDFYPSSDGEPMGETDLHRRQMNDLIETLLGYFADQPEVYVSGNNFLYYQQGDPKKVVSPDCYVVRGVPMRLRDTYKVWEEGGKLPCVVLEITSRTTKQVDLRTKLPLYQKTLQVPEYFMFDPTADYLKPPLRGFRLVGGVYQRIVEEGTACASKLYSVELGLYLQQVGHTLRLVDPVTGERLRTPAEQAVYAQEQARYAEEQAQYAQQQARRAEVQTRRAEAQARVAAAQAHRAETAESEILRLRAELEALRREKQN